MAGLSDLDFDHGIGFSSLASQRFGCSVSPTTAFPKSAFHLVASFGRSAIRLNEDSVGLILQACLGGVAKDFCVLHLSGWMFSFSISCKDVGFLVYNLKHFSCKSYSIFFHLWGDGGPNWCRDYALWRAEQDADWTLIGSKGKPSYAQVTSSPKVNPDRGFKKSVFLRLNYPSDYGESFLQPLPPKLFAQSRIQKHTRPARLHRARVLRWVPKNPAPTVTRLPSVHEQSAAPIFSNLNGKVNTGLDCPPMPKSQSGPLNGPGPTLHCGKCLGTGHLRKDCASLVRCNICYNYGHVSRSCLSKLRHQRRFRPISRLKGEAAVGEAHITHPAPLEGSVVSPPTCTRDHCTIPRKSQPSRSHGELGGGSPPIPPQRLHPRCSCPAPTFAP